MRNLLTQRYQPRLIEMAEELCHKNREPSFVLNFLESYLTPGEIGALAIRWEIIKRISRGETHRDIAASLRVSPTTVSRWALEDWRKRWGE